jgi:hypothetical protein
MFPAARSDQLLIKEVGDELVVYDQTNHSAHRLNQPAARVWRLCDGRQSIDDLARRLGEESQHPVDRRYVEIAVDELCQAGLLSDHAAGTETLPRRAAVRRLGRLAGIALLPLVTSIVAPTPADTQSSPQGGRPGRGGRGRNNRGGRDVGRDKTER